MSLGAAIFTRASTEAGLTALIGSGADARIYKLQIPQGGATAPYIIWQTVSGLPMRTHNAPVDLSFATVQFACFATTPEGATTLREALIAAFDNVELSHGETAVLQEDGRDDYEEAVQLYRADADFVIPHRH